MAPPRYVSRHIVYKYTLFIKDAEYIYTGVGIGFTECPD